MAWPALALVAALAVAGARGGGPRGRSVAGVIIEVQATSITAIESFTLRDNDGETLTFRVAPDAVDDPIEGLFPSHLRTHTLAAEQVTVTYREENGTLLVLRLEHE